MDQLWTLEERFVTVSVGAEWRRVVWSSMSPYDMGSLLRLQLMRFLRRPPSAHPISIFRRCPLPRYIEITHPASHNLRNLPLVNSNSPSTSSFGLAKLSMEKA